ncbi:MAG: hypothetical protein ABW000_12990 [Actinoplanes sp.]
MITTAQDEINLYVFAVRAALGDLPESLRDELLEDLPEHLAEVLADGVGSLTDRLGSPEAYAAELRSTAGFVGGFPDPPKPNQLREARDQALRVLRVADERVGPLFGYAHASEFLVQLRPAWWVLRGYLAAMVLAWLLDDSGQPIGLLPRIGGSEIIALLLLAAGILGSIWLGRRRFHLAKWPQLSLYAGSVILVLVALGGFLSADSTSRGAFYSDVNYDNGYNNPYANVQDVFIYDEHGRLITNARILDQDGQPISLGNSYCTDEFGNSSEVGANTYPHCPSQAPFRLESDDPSPSVRPGDPAPSSEPSAVEPSVAATPAPSEADGKGREDPSVKPSRTPAPSPSR